MKIERLLEMQKAVMEGKLAPEALQAVLDTMTLDEKLQALTASIQIACQEVPEEIIADMIDAALVETKPTLH